MKKCPSCSVKTFSALGQQSLYGADGSVCNNCGTRVRAKVFVLATIIPSLLGTLMVSQLWFSWAPWSVKIAMVVISYGLISLLFQWWPLIVHPWERGAVDGSVKSDLLVD